MKVKVRGIYSTAISKLLIDKGQEIVDAGKLISQRLGVSSGSPDIEIRDLPSKEGIRIKGKGAKEIVKLLREALPNIVTLDKSKGKIYVSIVKGMDENNKNIIVDTPEGEGIIDMRSFWGYAKPGSKILAQQKGRSSNYLVLTTQLRLFGEDCVIISNGFNKMSSKIRSEAVKSKLMKIIRELNVKNKGVLWKASAAQKDEEYLKKEINELLSLDEKIRKEFDESDSPKILYEGLEEIVVLFDTSTKSELDKIRSLVVPTIDGHHLLKSGGYQELVDILENLDLKYPNILEKIKQTLSQYGPLPKQKYEVLLIGLDGKTRKLVGSVESFDGNTLSIHGKGSFEIYANGGIKQKGGEYSLLTYSLEVFPKFARAIYLGRAKTKEDAIVLLERQKSLLNNTIYESIKGEIDRLWSS